MEYRCDYCGKRLSMEYIRVDKTRKLVFCAFKDENVDIMGVIWSGVDLNNHAKMYSLRDWVRVNDLRVLLAEIWGVYFSIF